MSDEAHGGGYDDVPTYDPYPAAPPLPEADEAALLEGLNEPQREAVTVPGGPVLVLAGPGSGKTRVLTRRVAWLVGVRGVPPWRILGVTFTNKAAREMKERLSALLGEGALDRLTIGTFHGVCARVLRMEAGKPETTGSGPGTLPFDRDFVIFDADDQRRLVRRALADLDIDEKRYSPRAVLGAISNAKNELLRPADYSPPSYFHEVAARVWERYDALLRASNGLDFDDLLLETAELLRHNEAVRDRYRARYRHLLVDEFQDTNTAQYALVKALAAAEDAEAEHNLFVVGDEDQSIYRWRGADWRNIQRFRRDFPAARTILLEQNYRSSQVILDAARAVIDRNRHRTPKKLWTESRGGQPITLREAYDEAEEAAWVVRLVGEHARRGDTYGDIAVMYRTNAQSRLLEDALVRRRVPYQLVGATRFYDRREVRDALAYLRLAHNPRDEVSFERVINVPPRGIGKKTYADLAELARSGGLGLREALARVAAGEEARVPGAPTFAPRAHKALGVFHALLATLEAAREELCAGPLLDLALRESGYADWLRDGSEEGEERWENVLELRNVAADYDELPPRESLATMLEAVALVSDVDGLEGDQDRVTLLTLHAAKGLEFPVVIITGLEEDTLPHARSQEDEEGLEEERRLLYVGITRARRKLYLMHAFRRTIFGSSEPRERSRFLDDLPVTLQTTGEARRRAAKRETSWKPARSGSAGGAGAAAAKGGGSAFRPGDKVRHGSFGAGVVVASKAVGDDEEVTVAFEGAGVKKLLQSFARLEKA